MSEQKRVPHHLSPDSRLGKFMASEFKKLCPNDDYHFMELMGDGTLVFHIKDKDQTRFGTDIMSFAKIPQSSQGAM